MKMKKTMVIVAAFPLLLFLGCSTVQPQPDVARAYDERGRVDMAADNYGKGISDFTKAIEFDPDDAYSYMGRGLAYLKDGDREKADADFSKAASMDPDLKDVLKSLKGSGWQYLADGDNGSKCYLNANSVSSVGSGAISYVLRYDAQDDSYTMYNFELNCRTHQGRWQNIWPKYYSAWSEWESYGDNSFYEYVARKYCR